MSEQHSVLISRVGECSVNEFGIVDKIIFVIRTIICELLCLVFVTHGPY